MPVGQVPVVYVVTVVNKDTNESMIFRLGKSVPYVPRTGDRLRVGNMGTKGHMGIGVNYVRVCSQCDDVEVFLNMVHVSSVSFGESAKQLLSGGFVRSSLPKMPSFMNVLFDEPKDTE